ncbi:MAG: HDOD domain-containing protein [Bdellovibrionota bacterium]|jgi:HD-like signal output (HDOD) protein
MDQHTAPLEFEGRLSKGKDWREIVAWVGDLPPMPQTASRAVRLVEDPNTDASQLSKVLEMDTALAARVLKIANSAMFCRQREITTLQQAIMIIGLKSLKGIIVAATIQQMNKSMSKIQKIIWENSICTAIAATIITKKLRYPYVDELFLLGLLHSLGQIVLATQTELTKGYLQVLQLIKERHLDYVNAEQEVFGFAHPLIGALVAKKWNFPGDSCQIILHYKDPVESFSSEIEQDKKAMIIQLADMLCHHAGLGSPEGYFTDERKIELLQEKLNLSPKEAPTEIIQETSRHFRDERHLYE